METYTEKTHEPILNQETGQWEIWDFAYQENDESFYEVHKFWDYFEAIKYYNTLIGK